MPAALSVWSALYKFVNQIALMLIVLPVCAALVTQLGFDPIWCWMMFLVTILFGGVTPPFGYTMFVIKAAAPEVPIGDIYRAMVPVLTIALLALIVMAIFPAIVTWCPRAIEPISAHF